MSLKIDHPTRVRILDHNDRIEAVKGFLTYTDKSVAYQIQRMKHAPWFDAEVHADKLEELMALRRPCLLKEDDSGFYTLSGLAQDLKGILGVEVENLVEYPKANLIPWEKVPPPLRPYQQETVDLFLEHKHAAAELATGLGKSYILLWLVKQLGLKTVVMAPTTSIANQLYEDFITYLGRKRVGKFYGGKKESGKLVTVAIHASLAKVEADSEHFARLNSTMVFVADESHLCPADTLFKVCSGLCGNAPYRFFLSGTQMRGDGADILLRGITGPVLKSMTVKDGVDQGWLAKPSFRMLQITSGNGYRSADAMKMTQKHLLYNPIAIQKAAAIANAAVSKLGHQVLILIDEVKQFRFLLPYLRHQTKFAHGPLSGDNEKDVPEEYKDVDNTKLVKEFNDKKYPILIGTSAVGMGTDIRSVQTLIYFKGGKSEVEVRQGVGRGTRKVPGKDECIVIDFDVTNIDLLHRHATERAEIYRDIYPDMEYV